MNKRDKCWRKLTSTNLLVLPLILVQSLWVTDNATTLSHLLCFSVSLLGKNRGPGKAGGLLSHFPVCAASVLSIKGNPKGPGKVHGQACESTKRPVRVSHGCCSKWPQIWQLKTPHVFSYSSGCQKSYVSCTGLKSGCQEGRTRSGGSRGKPICLLFQLLELKSASLSSRPLTPSSKPEAQHFAEAIKWPHLLLWQNLCSPSVQIFEVMSLGLPE